MSVFVSEVDIPCRIVNIISFIVLINDLKKSNSKRIALFVLISCEYWKRYVNFSLWREKGV